MTVTLVNAELGDTPNAELQRRAREALQGIWGMSVGIAAIYIVLTSGASSIPRIGWLISLLISGPLTLDLCFYFLAPARGKSSRIGVLFDGFTRFSQALIIYLLMVLYYPTLVVAADHSRHNHRAILFSDLFHTCRQPHDRSGRGDNSEQKDDDGKQGETFSPGTSLYRVVYHFGFDSWHRVFPAYAVHADIVRFFYEDIRAAQAAQPFFSFLINRKESVPACLNGSKIRCVF